MLTSVTGHCQSVCPASRPASQSVGQRSQSVSLSVAAGKRVSPKYAKYLAWLCLQISYTLGCIRLADQLWVWYSGFLSVQVRFNYGPAIEQVCI